MYVSKHLDSLLINRKIFWALTHKAEAVIDSLEKKGFDKDLALAMLEQMWEEEDIYCFDDRPVTSFVKELDS